MKIELITLQHSHFNQSFASIQTLYNYSKLDIYTEKYILKLYIYFCVVSKHGVLNKVGINPTFSYFDNCRKYIHSEFVAITNPGFMLKILLQKFFKKS